MKGKEMVCIVCPLGCRISVSKEESDYTVDGNKCPRGKDYGIKELTNPTRVLTTTVKIKDGLLNRLPVKTKEAIPKNKVFECMKIIDSIEIKTPISVGDVIVKDILNTGVDVIASRSM
ncbi:DUF1667 domain-containing protein [Wukongibacter baidiensis]|uniref:DUF1667 domain-containing protein n=1 Tax=Wukongibacter baidiensis TaxID=1723361 RepID=UPI003D7F3A8F